MLQSRSEWASDGLHSAHQEPACLQLMDRSPLLLAPGGHGWVWRLYSGNGGQQALDCGTRREQGEQNGEDTGGGGLLSHSEDTEVSWSLRPDSLKVYGGSREWLGRREGGREPLQQA